MKAEIKITVDDNDVATYEMAGWSRSQAYALTVVLADVYKKSRKPGVTNEQAADVVRENILTVLNARDAEEVAK